MQKYVAQSSCLSMMWEEFMHVLDGGMSPGVFPGTVVPCCGALIKTSKS